MSNWRELPAGRELDVEISRSLGWTVSDDAEIYTLDPNGNQGNFTRIPSGVYAPRLSVDANAALRLWATEPLPDDWLWKLSYHVQVDMYSCMLIDQRDHPVLHEEAQSPALAICRAWLAWKETADAQQA